MVEEGTLRHRRRLVGLACPVVVRNLAAALLPRLVRLPPPPAEEEQQKDRLATSGAGAVMVVKSEAEDHPSDSNTTRRSTLERPGPLTLDGDGMHVRISLFLLQSKKALAIVLVHSLMRVPGGKLRETTFVVLWSAPIFVRPVAAAAAASLASLSTSAPAMSDALL